MPYSKYKARKIVNEYGRFDSKKEYFRYLTLKALEEEGLITDLQRQVPYELIPRQLAEGKVAERAVKYFADFQYMKDGKLVVEDVKGFKTPEYKLKRKLMLFIHKIKIVEI